MILAYGAESNRTLGIPGEVGSNPKFKKLCPRWWDESGAAALLVRGSLMGLACVALQDLRGVISAREFVWWFNGHPDGAQLPVDLSKACCSSCLVRMLARAMPELKGHQRACSDQQQVLAGPACRAPGKACDARGELLLCTCGR